MSSKKRKTKIIIGTKNIGSVGNIKLNGEKPFNVVGNCRLSESREYLALRLNGDTRNVSVYLGILKTDVYAIQDCSLSVCFVSMNDNDKYIIVGTARQTKNKTGISLCVTINDIIRYLVISNRELEKIFSSRNYVGKIVEYKNTQKIKDGHDFVSLNSDAEYVDIKNAVKKE